MEQQSLVYNLKILFSSPTSFGNIRNTFLLSFLFILSHDRLTEKSAERGNIGSNPIREKSPSEIGLYAGGSIIQKL